MHEMFHLRSVFGIKALFFGRCREPAINANEGQEGSLEATTYRVIGVRAAAKRFLMRIDNVCRSRRLTTRLRVEYDCLLYMEDGRKQFLFFSFPRKK
jgi:hypothetical protein